MNPVIIPFNRAKLWWLSFVCVLFIILGFFFVLVPYDFKSPLIHNLFIIRVLGFISLALFGYFLGLYLSRLKYTGAGLIIDENGITDHSTAVSVGLVRWDDITDIRRKAIASQKLMIVKVRNPDDYVAKVTGEEKIRSLKERVQLCGSPVAIPSHTLKCSFKQLETLLTDAFERYKKVD